MSDGLFRKEAQEKQFGSLGGDILLVHPVSWTLATAAILVLVALLIAFLVFGQYTRKERTFGVVASQMGTTRILAPEAGIVVRRTVEDGQSVAAGELLFELDLSRQTDQGNIQGLLQEAIEAQRKQIDTEMRQKVSLSREALVALRQKQVRLQGEVVHLDAEIGLQEAQVDAARRLADNLRPLYEDRLVSEAQYQQQVSSHLENRARLESLKRNRLTLAGELKDTESQLRQEAMRSISDQAILERSRLATDQELIQHRGSGMLQLKAARAGTITALLTSEGQYVDQGASLATLLPAGGALEAYLFVSSSAIGFVKPGQTVRLRYDAFPYQKFGQHEGKVTEVAVVDIPARDLTSRFPQLTDKGAAFFRITVALPEGQIDGYGHSFQLRPGMTLEADVMLERKRIIEWIFDPVLAMAKKI